MAGTAEAITFTAWALDQTPGFRFSVTTCDPAGNQRAMNMDVTDGKLSLRARGRRRPRAEYARVRTALEPRMGAMIYVVEALGRDIAKVLRGASLVGISYSADLGDLDIWLTHEKGTLEAEVVNGKLKLRWMRMVPVPLRREFATEYLYQTTMLRWESRFGQVRLGMIQAQLAAPILDCHVQIQRVLPPKEVIELAD